MISYLKFKKIFDAIHPTCEPEIELHFYHRPDSYMVIKYSGKVTFQRCGTVEEQSGEIEFASLDELYETQTIDDICLKNEWDDISDIVFDGTFCMAEDYEDSLDRYGIK